MRTTLKKGIGRGAELNGNGHAVLPPDVVTRMTRYRQPKRSALRFAGKVLFSLFAMGLMVGARARRRLLPVPRRPGRESEPLLARGQARAAEARQGASARPAGDRPSWSATTARLEDIKTGSPSRSDTLMLVRADPTTDSLSMLSFPRDLRVGDPLPEQPLLRPDQPGLRVVRPRGLARDGQGAHGPPDQLPDHDQLPRLQAARGQGRRRLDGRRPPLLQRQHERGRALRRDRPAARLPEAERPEDARLRPLPAHGLGPLPQRAAADVRAGAQGAGLALVRRPRRCRRSSTRSATT